MKLQSFELKKGGGEEKTLKIVKFSNFRSTDRRLQIDDLSDTVAPIYYCEEYRDSKSEIEWYRIKEEDEW